MSIDGAIVATTALRSIAPPPKKRARMSLRLVATPADATGAPMLRATRAA